MIRRTTRQPGTEMSRGDASPSELATYCLHAHGSTLAYFQGGDPTSSGSHFGWVAARNLVECVGSHRAKRRRFHKGTGHVLVMRVTCWR
jgi:hypothetical protein